ncbi:MAG: hypothetical protein HKN62_01570 [Phycisphaerales bacterium]|nr:hypothetical protein [Phycisphaerales bacterium]
MRRVPDKLPLLAAIVASIMVHVVVLVPLLILVMTAPARPPSVAGRFHPDDLTPAEEPPPDETRLGIDARTPSTMTWVGHREYQEHLAERAEFEQAAFTRVTPAPMTPVPSPTETPAAPAPPPASEAASPPSALPPLVAELLRLPSVEPTVPLASPAETDERVESEVPGPPIPTPAPAESPAKEPSTPSPPPEPAPDGEPADKDADATSVIDVPLDQIKRGKPLARPGLELKPQRPHFTTLTLLTAAPCDPLVRISFRRDGRPATAAILKTSCDRRVDAAVENSLYRWRASGKQLESLGPEETLDVELRIVLGGR